MMFGTRERSVGVSTLLVIAGMATATTAAADPPGYQRSCSPVTVGAVKTSVDVVRGNVSCSSAQATIRRFGTSKPRAKRVTPMTVNGVRWRCTYSRDAVNNKRGSAWRYLCDAKNYRWWVAGFRLLDDRLYVRERRRGARRAFLEAGKVQRARTGAVYGKVTDDQGRAVSGADVAIHVNGPDEKRTRTSRDGRFALDDVRPGRVRMWVVPRSQNRHVLRMVAVTVKAGKPVTANATLPRAGTIRGEVRDAAGRAVPNARIYLGTGKPDGMTDRSGRFVIRGVRSGTAQMSVGYVLRGKRSATAPQAVRVRGWGVVTVRLVVPAGATAG